MLASKVPTLNAPTKQTRRAALWEIVSLVAGVGGGGKVLAINLVARGLDVGLRSQGRPSIGSSCWGSGPAPGLCRRHLRRPLHALCGLWRGLQRQRLWRLNPLQHETTIRYYRIGT